MNRKSVRDIGNVSKFSTVDALIREKTIIYGLVTGTNFNALDKSEEMVVRIPEGVLDKGQTNAVIRREDADNIFSSGTVNYLVGRIVPFVIIKEEGGKVFASRKLAQDMLRKEIDVKLKRKEMLDAEILSFTAYGAFVSVNGVVGMLKNTDFSLDHTSVEEVHRTGDHIRVFCKSVASESGKIYFEPEIKYHRPEAALPDFSVGSVLLGKIVSLRVFGENPFAFVRVATGIDVLSMIPGELKPAVGQNCKVQITDIRETDAQYEPVKVKGIVRGIV